MAMSSDTAELMEYDGELFRCLLPEGAGVKPVNGMLAVQHGRSNFTVDLRQDALILATRKMMLGQVMPGTGLMKVTTVRQGALEGKHSGVEVLTISELAALNAVTCGWLLALDMPCGGEIGITLQIMDYTPERLAMWEKVVDSIEFK